MNNRDWGFLTGDLGDPLADIKDWMLIPYPKHIKEKLCQYIKGKIKSPIHGANDG